jgi:dTDP-4-amino-4,6-dideoxygalactose transaminase
MTKLIPKSKFSPWPSFSKNEAKLISDVLMSNKVNYWTGNKVKKFEDDFSKWTGAKYSIALSNGTVALDIAIKALGISKNDEVIVTPRTFIASVSSVCNVGAKPIFADIDLDSGNITAESIVKVITMKTKAIICVHLGGWPCDMDPIIKIARKHDIKIIEDCSQAHGALYKGRSVGQYGDIATWSFCQDKIITTGGEGGMVTTNNKKYWDIMWSYKDHGKSHKAVFKKKNLSGFRWLHDSFGTNFRMTEIQAVIGVYQLKKMKKWTETRNRNASQIIDSFRDFEGVYIPSFQDKFKIYRQICVHAYYKLYIYLDFSNFKELWSRDKIVDQINKEGVPASGGSCPEVYLEKAFIKKGLGPKKRLPNAMKLGKQSIALMVHPTLKKEEIEKTISVIKKIISKARK